MIANYEKQVYTAMLGKVIGVYLGRPFEGWSKQAIEARWGEIGRYVHTDQNVPLVVVDDDITGTFTFIKVLADSGLYEETPDRLYGENWLNYLLEGQTVLWWGGVSNSTEHTAFCNLTRGIESPESGSIRRNGREVAEQIGAQIFIDAFGMVAPGRPELAVRLAEKAARVSHDGEAVLAAKVVAAMVSLAFEIKDMNRLLDEAVTWIPGDSLIAQVHRDVRAWAAEDGDWRRTYARIDERYGYRIYGGNCHVIPNHAIMVMAWAYAGNDFFKALQIICTAGWDTDCNAANVGCVSALVAGLEHLCDTYDFRTPFADRLLLPTADGTDSVTDVLRLSQVVAAIGRRIMKAEPLPAPKGGALHHFEMPGAVHGYQRSAGRAQAVTVAAPAGSSGTRGLGFSFGADRAAPARIATPLLAVSTGRTAYTSVSTPRLYNGMTVQARIHCQSLSAPASLRLFVRTTEEAMVYSQPIELRAGASADISWVVEAGFVPLQEFGLETASEQPSEGEVVVEYVDFGGAVKLEYPVMMPSQGPRAIPGWISNLDFVHGRFSNDSEEWFSIGRNEYMGLMVTGNRSWNDCSVGCGFKIHAAERAGVLLRYQGVRRHYGVWFTKDTVQIVRNCYGEQVLAAVPLALEENRGYKLEARVEGDQISVSVDGRRVLTARDATFAVGGAGFAVERGVSGFRELALEATTRDFVPPGAG